MDYDTRVRIKAFEWLCSEDQRLKEYFTRAELYSGFQWNSSRIALASPQGIHIPAGCRFPLSIITVVGGPYDDRIDDSGLLIYSYKKMRGHNEERENIALREAIVNQVPLIYIFGIEKGKYLPMYPAYMVADNPSAREFSVAIDEVGQTTQLPVDTVHDATQEARRAYVTSVARRRIHQRQFRETVLTAYKESCAICKLNHRDLLDAAHIIGDTEADGDPVISNGISLCKIHHTAFDNYYFGIRPDHRVIVRDEILREKDGPMLQHGLKDIHHQLIRLPNRRIQYPDQQRLEKRFERFLARTGSAG
jgi:putative restriction endonuclease